MRILRLCVGVTATSYWLLVIGSQFSIFNFQFSIENALSTPVAKAQIDNPHSLYNQVKTLVEQEVNTKESELSVQRFAVGTYYDHEIITIEDRGPEQGINVPFEIEDEQYVDFSIQTKMQEMCGESVGNQEGINNDYATCLQAQGILKQAAERAAWTRRLGRNLQMIASGYEVGIDGYPGKPVNVIPRLSSIAHLWRASNDVFISPILEERTRARPWPSGTENAIKQQVDEIMDLLDGMVRHWEEKTDETEKAAAIWRYRHGVQYVINREGPCEEAPEFPNDPAHVWQERRWCEVEEALSNLRTILQTDTAPIGNAEHILYPSVVRQQENIFLWMRRDDVGLQWYIPFEPVQAALLHPDFGDCLEGDTARNCYDTYAAFIVRGGRYPTKKGIDEPISYEATTFIEELSIDESVEHAHAVVPEPHEGEGICSHPFAKRGYLCRQITSEACTLTKQQQDQLATAGTGGIVLTRCQPERFRDDIARTVSGPNICGIGGWREDVQPDSILDTPERQPEMTVPKCSACAVDIVCKERCTNDFHGYTNYVKRNGVIEICIDSDHGKNGYAAYQVAHELVHAQQICNESTLQSFEHSGLLGMPEQKDAAACCAAEREAYFVLCKMYAQDGVLERAGITIDQCASSLSNFSCKAHDEDPDDTEYPCSNDSVDPEVIDQIINEAREEIADTKQLPDTCEEALQEPRIRALYNSFPLVCKPGCAAQYQNTIGNNLCYAGQCIEQMHEWSRQGTGRAGITTVDQDFAWDACQLPDPNIGAFEVPPAITSPTFPLYRPELVVQMLDHALCQINGLPARSPPILCAFNPQKRLGLPGLNYVQSADDLVLQPEQYAATGLGIQYAASGIGARITSNMLTQYLKPAGRQLADLLNMTHHLFDRIGDIKLPTTMCARNTENVTCDTYFENR